MDQYREALIDMMAAAPSLEGMICRDGESEPFDALYVGEGTDFANFFTVGSWVIWADDIPAVTIKPDQHADAFQVADAKQATELYREWVLSSDPFATRIRESLEGHIYPVACNCALSTPCHGDIIAAIGHGII